MRRLLLAAVPLLALPCFALSQAPSWEELSARLDALAREAIAEPELSAGEIEASRNERDEALDKARKLVAKYRKLADEQAILSREREAAEAALRDAEKPAAALTAHERRKLTEADIEALEQSVDLARYQAGNRARRVETLRGEVESVRDRLAESKELRGRARERRERADRDAALAGKDGARARAEGRVAQAIVEMEELHSSYLAVLLETRQARLEIAEIEARVQALGLEKKAKQLAAAQSALGVSREEAQRRRDEIRQKLEVLERDQTKLEADIRAAAEDELLAERTVKEGQGKEAEKGAVPSEEALALARTRLDTAVEKRKAFAEELARDRLETGILEHRLTTWEKLARASEADAVRRERLAAAEIDTLRAERLRLEEKRRTQAKLQEIARDDLDQIGEAIRYAETRLDVAEEMGEGEAREERGAKTAIGWERNPEDFAKGGKKKKELLEAVLASLKEAQSYGQRRVLALSEAEGVIERQVEFLDEAVTRLSPFAASVRSRVTLQSFRDLLQACGTALAAVASVSESPRAHARDLSTWLSEGPRASEARRVLSRALAFALCFGALAFVVARALHRMRLDAARRPATRAAASIVGKALAPLVLLAVLSLGISPFLPAWPEADEQSIDASYARATITAVVLLQAAALCAGAILLAAGARAAAEVLALPEDRRLRLSRLLGYARGGALAYVGLHASARLSLLWAAPASVPFLLDSAAILLAIAAGGLMAFRLRRDIERLLEVHHLAEADAAVPEGLLAATYNRLVHSLLYLIAIYLLSLLALYVVGYGTFSLSLLIGSIKVFLITLAAFGIGKLLQRSVQSRLRDLDRAQAITADPHALEREALRAGYGLVILALSVATLAFALSTFGMAPGEAWERASDLLRLRLVTVNGTPVTLLSVLTFVAIFGGAFLLSRALRRFLIRQVFPRARVDKGVQHALSTMLNYAILLCAFFAGFQAMGFDLTTLKVIAGAVGLGIGFGLQNIAANFVSGLIILIERPIKPDDVVEVSGTLGRVETVSARATHVRTRDNISVIVPNAEFIQNRVVNWSHRDPRLRVRVPVPVAYGTDSDRVKEALLGVAARHPDVLPTPSPEVRFVAFGDSSLDFQLLVWIRDPWHSERIVSDLHYAIDRGLHDAGITIPFPQREIRILGSQGS